MGGPPILVTGVPRSGTTWLARLLASAPGTALTGREPMNPRGRQYALGGTLEGWTRLTSPSRRQRALLRTAYRGLNPLVYSRYGHRQLAAPLPWVRVVVKDPFALLSVPAVVTLTGARPVLVYRHPGAVLASYRRMGWRPDLTELAGVVAGMGPAGAALPPLPGPGEASPAEEMAAFWGVLHEIALDQAGGTGMLVVSHAEVAGGGSVAGRELTRLLGLRWSSAMERELSATEGAAAGGAEARSGAGPQGGAGVPADRLHNFDRAPSAVAEEWRSRVSADEMAALEQVCGATLARLAQSRTPLS